MLVKLLNIISISFFVLGTSLMVWVSIDSSPFEKVFGITWIFVTSNILVAILSLGIMSNVMRLKYKDKELKLDHVKKAFVLNVLGFLFFDWKDGWPLLSTWFG